MRSPDPDRVFATLHHLLLIGAGILALATFTVCGAIFIGSNLDVLPLSAWLDMPPMPGRGW